MKHIMVDLETLDNSSTSCIVSIGAVLFDFEKDEVYETWYLTVDANSCVKAGLTMSPDTVLWGAEAIGRSSCHVQRARFES